MKGENFGILPIMLIIEKDDSKRIVLFYDFFVYFYLSEIMTYEGKMSKQKI